MRKPTFGQRRGKPIAAEQSKGGYRRPSRLDDNFPEARGSIAARGVEGKKWVPRKRGGTSVEGAADAAAAPKVAPVVAPPSKRPPPGSGFVTEKMRIAKAMARAGLCSRRDAERWIADGRVTVNGQKISSPALDVGPKDRIAVDGEALPDAEPARLWRFHKPKGYVTTHSDPEGRPTVFDHLPKELPRVVSIGRLDFNTEGLLLLTNDGELARHLELPSTGWLRKYRVRAHGVITQARLDTLKDGIEIDGVRYGPIEAALDGHQGGGNVWMTIGLREGKNREVKNILASLDLKVNRLIRVSFGPFQLMDLDEGKAESVKRRVLADQLGPEVSKTFGLDVLVEEAAAKAKLPHKPQRPGAPGNQGGNKSGDKGAGFLKPGRQGGDRQSSKSERSDRSSSDRKTSDRQRSDRKTSDQLTPAKKPWDKSRTD
jgi:23S rRNA pseudouridine2605 synthase